MIRMGNPTNGELALMIQSLGDELRLKHETISSDVKDVKVQATLTNGRLRKLEQWKYMIIGAIAVLSFFQSNIIELLKR